MEVVVSNNGKIFVVLKFANVLSESLVFSNEKSRRKKIRMIHTPSGRFSHLLRLI